MIRRRLAFTLALASALVTPAAGCGAYRPNLPAPAALAAAEKTYAPFEEGDLAWAARNIVPEAERGATIRRAVAAWEKARAIDPTSEQLFTNLAIACYYLANYYTPDEDEREEIHAKGMAYGQEALLLDPQIKKAVEEDGLGFEEAIPKYAKVHHVPAIYWMAVNWGRVVENKNIATRATTAPKLKAIQETVYRLGPRYYWGGVHRFFGVYYTKAPGQKDPGPSSKKEFDLAVATGPENLENKVLYAQYYATFVQDRALYEKLLREVLATPDTFGPLVLRLDNSEARKRARLLLAEADDRF